MPAPTENRAQLEVAAIEVDGICDDIAKVLATYPGMPEPVVRALTQAVAELIGASLALIHEAEK